MGTRSWIQACKKFLLAIASFEEFTPWTEGECGERLCQKGTLQWFLVYVKVNEVQGVFGRNCGTHFTGRVQR